MPFFNSNTKLSWSNIRHALFGEHKLRDLRNADYAALLLPIRLTISYLILSIFIYIVCPFNWTTYKPILFYSLLTLYLFALWFGYRLGLICKVNDTSFWQEKYTDSLIRILSPLIVVNFIIYIVNIFRDYSFSEFDFVELGKQMWIGIQNPGLGYNLRCLRITTTQGSDVIGGSFFSLINYIWSFIRLPIIISSMLFLKKLKPYAKVMAILYLIVVVLFYMSIGTNIDILLVFLFIELPAILDFFTQWRNKSLSGKKVIKLVASLLAGVLLIFSYFTWMMVSRGGINRYDDPNYNVGGVTIDIGQDNKQPTTTVPNTEPDTTVVPETTLVPETTVMPQTTTPETTAPKTTTPETTAPKTTTPETTTPETTALKTTTPETTTPETTAPETTTPETTAPKTTTPETTAPKTTTPETTAPKTTTPETTAPKTTTPETTAPKTTTPETTTPDTTALVASGENTSSSSGFTVPPIIMKFWVSFSSYFTQGYYGMSQALTLPWVPMYGTGSSMFVVNFISEHFYDIDQFTYQVRMEPMGWDSDVNWHSMYTWLANDFSFYGVVIVMFLLGLLFGLMFKDAVCNKNPFAMITIFHFMLIILFIPCNNQLGQRADYLFSFVFMVICWVLSHIPRFFKKN